MNTRFVDLEYVGAGDFGEVYSATDSKLGRKVALKYVPLPARRDVDALAHAKALAAVSHPNIVTVHDILEDVPQPSTHARCDAVVMAWLDGESLASRLKRSALSVEEARRTADGVLDAIEYLQGQGYAHGDLHDENVLLTRDRPILIDLVGGALRSRSTGSATAQLLGADLDACARLVARIVGATGASEAAFLQGCPTRAIAEQRASAHAVLLGAISGGNGPTGEIDIVWTSEKGEFPTRESTWQRVLVNGQRCLVVVPEEVRDDGHPYPLIVDKAETKIRAAMLAGALPEEVLITSGDFLQS